MPKFTVDLDELRETGVTVVRGFLPPAVCQQAREALDAFLGPEPTQKARVGLETEWGHPSQGGSNNGLHTIGHPNSMLAIFAPHFPELVDIHAQVLRSEPRHLRLNGQNMKRADPTDAAGAYGDGLPQAKNWHVDNVYLPQHNETTPRQVYSRAMVTLNSVSSGGAAFMIAKRSTTASRDCVDKLIAERGEEAYLADPLVWRRDVAQELTARLDAPNPELDASSEVLSNEGDMVIFEPESLHAASRCVNGQPRYNWTSSFFDTRALDLPHKLYQTEFAPELVAALPASLRQTVDWVVPFVERWGDLVLGKETQFHCWGARRQRPGANL